MKYINETHIYPGVVIIGLMDYIIHGAITGMTLVMPLICVVALLILEMIKDIHSSIKINGGDKNEK